MTSLSTRTAETDPSSWLRTVWSSSTSSDNGQREPVKAAVAPPS